MQDQDLLFSSEDAEARAKAVQELASVRAELSRVQAELLAEREGRQISETALRDQVAEVEVRQEVALAAVKDAASTNDALKKECSGNFIIFVFLFCLPFPLFPSSFHSFSFFFSLDLLKEKKRLLKEAEEMKETLRTSENRLEQVRVLAEAHVEEAEEQLAQAKLIRRGANRDLLQALTVVKELRTQLAASEGKLSSLWSSVKSVVAMIRLPEDGALCFGDFVPLIPARFSGYLRKSFRTCVSNILGHVRVLVPDAPLDKLAEESASPDSLHKLMLRSGSWKP